MLDFFYFICVISQLFTENLGENFTELQVSDKISEFLKKGSSKHITDN